MNIKNIILITLVTILSLACVSKKQKDNTINISGAFALYPITIQWAEEFKKGHEEIRFNISAGGAGKGMADAMAGTVDIGMFSREISAEEKNKGVWWVGLCIDAVLPTVSAENPYIDEIKQGGMTRDEFRKIFIDGTITTWAQILNKAEGHRIENYTRSDACGAASTWAKYLGGKQEDIIGVGIHGDPALAEAVSKDPYGIAFNNTAFVYDIKTGALRQGLEVIPIDLNNNGIIDPEEDFYYSFDALLDAVTSGIYPSPPARELYFVAKEKPQKKATINFIEWILTDGQKLVKQSGYVPISPEEISKSLNKIK